MIKAVLFDYGGVMSDGGRGTELIGRVAANLGVSTERATELVNIAWSPYANGMINEAELWEQIEEEYGSPIPEAKRGVWNTWEVMKPWPEMVEFVKQLRGRGLIVGLLSNVIPATLTEINTHGGYEDFDFLVLSCEVGYSKPQVEIYQLALDRLEGIKSEEVLFVDDQERFLVPARELGIHTILAESQQQVIADVEAALNR